MLDLPQIIFHVFSLKIACQAPKPADHILPHRRSHLGIVPDPKPSAGSYYRSDHFSLSRVGIPAFSSETGNLYEGHDAAWGKKQHEDFTAHGRIRTRPQSQPQNSVIVTTLRSLTPLHQNVAGPESDCNMVLLSIREHGASNVIGNSALPTWLLFGAAMVAMGQSRQENLAKCQSGDPDSRIAGCTALIQADQDTTKNRAVIYGSRGVGYYSKGDYDRAIQDTDQAILLNPNEPSFYYTKGMAYKKKGDFDRAIKDFNEVIRLNPNFERAYYDRGNAYIDKEEYDRAILEFNEAIRLNPNNANNYNNRGVAYKRKGDYGRAIQDYNQAIHLNPNDTTAYLNRGDAYFAQSNLTAAIADFEYTISAAPSSSAAVSAALFLHVVMKRQGHNDAQELARVAAAADLSKWPGSVLKLDLGQATANEVMVAAASGVSAWQRWQVCEANYFTGEDALLHHQQTTALARLKAARDSCPKGDTGYTAALAELKRLGASAAPAK